MIHNQKRFEEVACNLCGSSSVRDIFVAIDWDSKAYESFKIVQCEKCGLIYTNPRPTKEVLYKYYYSPDYYTHKKKSFMPLQPIPHRFISKAKDYCKKIIKKIIYLSNKKDLSPIHRIMGFLLFQGFITHFHTKGRWGLIGEKGKLLDVGCGNGAYLYALKNDWLIADKIECFGIDIDSKAIENTKKMGIDAKVADSENIPFNESFFDIVAMKHSLEHMPNPAKTFREILRVIKPGGKIIIEVPNIESIGVKLLKDKWAGLDAPRHLYHYSPGTLRKILEKTGFEILAVNKWYGTFRRDISLKRMEQLWDIQGISNSQRKLKMLALQSLFVILDHVYKGGTFSIKAYKV